jgi:transcriptional regulator with XRE-family HTH domain
LREQFMRFGDFIKHKRLSDPRELTLKDMSERLGISLSFLSDIENNRRKPFDKDKIEMFAQVLNLSDEDKAKMYDLAARDRREIPSDIEDIMMYSEIGDMARLALRQSKAGVIDEEDWKTFIRDMEKKKGALAADNEWSTRQMQENVDIAKGKIAKEDLQLKKAEKAYRLAEEVLKEGGEPAIWLDLKLRELLDIESISLAEGF